MAIFLIAVLGLLSFFSAAVALQVRQNQAPLQGVESALVIPVITALILIGLHLLLRFRKVELEEMLLPGVGLLVMLGLAMIWRLRGGDGAWQQLRGYFLGMAIVGVLLAWPRWVDKIRQWAIPISIAGLGLSLATAAFGIQDQTGARLALALGPLSTFQTTEFIKVALIIFLAWFAEEEGRAVEGRTRLVMGWLRIPPLRYFLPGALFVATATLSLVLMADYGAVLILVFLFVGILFAAFETRTFITLLGIGAVLGCLVVAGLALAWKVPDVIHYRYLAFLDPWSSAPMLLNGQPTGITVSQGPGYQIQQSIYAMISGGVTGTGLGYGSPDFIPLAHSDFIFASLLEEMGGVVGIALLVLFAVIILRIFRVAILLPAAQTFERMLVVGIGIHLLAQVLVMVGGTVDLLPMTGVTVPFLSQGGTALMVNLAEVGVVLALVQRIGVRTL
jgi:cell division protein FtsW (lipid II flippase)